MKRSQRPGRPRSSVRLALRGAAQTSSVIAGFVLFGMVVAIAAGGGQPAYSRAVAPDPHPHQAHEPPAVDLWLVDGFNLLHAGLLTGQERSDRSGWWREEQRARVVTRVAQLRDPAPEICVVFDGSDPGPDALAAPEARVRVVFAPDADLWLLRRVRTSEQPERVALVTADRKLADRARHHGARIVAPRDFLARCDPA